MKPFYNAVFAAFVAFVGLGMVAQDAEAKRLGGGGSFGMKRNSTVMNRDAAPAPAAPTQSAAAAAKPATPTAAPAAQPSGMRKWLGPIAGLAAGLGIAALLSHFGLGEEFATLALVMLLAFGAVLVFKMMFRKRSESAGMQYAGAGAPMGGMGGMGSMGGSEPARFEPAAGNVGAGGAASVPSIPAGFDVEGFLRQAKLNYIRLQAANDRGDMDDIRNFTTPEVFAEIQMQFRERGGAKQDTDVQQLDAAVLDVSEEPGRYVVSVRFFGRIREEAAGPVENFDEVWHLSKPVAGDSGWVVAGIQQFQ